MIDLKETIEGAEAILRKDWGKERTIASAYSAYAEAYGYLKQGVVMYLEEQPERDEVVRAAHSTIATLLNALEAQKARGHVDASLAVGGWQACQATWSDWGRSIASPEMPASTPYEQELRERLAEAEQRLEDALKQPHPKDAPGQSRVIAQTIASVLQERDQLGVMCAAYEDKFKMQREVVCAAREWRKEPIGERSNELADAVDALNEWEKERAKEVAQTAGSFTCPTCGPHVKADEDGCCVTCGEDCKMEGA